MHPEPRQKSWQEPPGRRCQGSAAPSAGTGGCALALVLMIAGCMHDEPEATGAPSGDARQADAQSTGGGMGDHGGNAALPPPGLEPGHMPPPLADFPLPDDVIFVAPPLRDFGRLIVSLTSQADADEVAALFNAQLPANGYEITRRVVAGTRQWQFVKDGRRGLVALEQNRLATVITVNLFIEDRS
jgi:hypothetical protein